MTEKTLPNNTKIFFNKGVSFQPWQEGAEPVDLSNEPGVVVDSREPSVGPLQIDEIVEQKYPDLDLTASFIETKELPASETPRYGIKFNDGVRDRIEFFGPEDFSVFP